VFVSRVLGTYVYVSEASYWGSLARIFATTCLTIIEKCSIVLYSLQPLFLRRIVFCFRLADKSMPTSSSIQQELITINYTLEWPHLENASNTTFAGYTQIDICRCGTNNLDLGHVYTRYRCPRPEIHFTPPEENLWVLQEPLGQVNLLRPVTVQETRRRREIHHGSEPVAYAGKNFLLLSGLCPRGRYQAYATLQFLRSLSPPHRQNVESLSIFIQPYEEDCSDDQGGRAYVELARYILEELPAFKTLCLNIWGEETKAGSREFAMVLWKEGVKITVSWDWRSGQTEEYTDVEGFLSGIDEGVVAKRSEWETERVGEGADRDEVEDDTWLDEIVSSSASPVPNRLRTRKKKHCMARGIRRRRRG
jgi:hypothetical protein